MDIEHAREYVTRKLAGELSPAEAERLDAYIATHPEFAETAKRMEAVWKDLGLLAEPERTPRMAERLEQAVRKIGDPKGSDDKGGHVMEPKPVEPELRWLGSHTFWRVAAGILIAILAGVSIQSFRVSTRHASPAEAFLYSPPELSPGLSAGVRVFVRDAWRNRPLREAKVRVILASSSGPSIPLSTAVTDANGFANIEAQLPPDITEGGYKLEVKVASNEGDTEVSRPIEVRRSFRTMLTTDKPVYQPGQVMHIRTLSLATADMRPVTGRDLVIEVRDPKGNKVFKKLLKTSEFGIASADFELADQVNTGDYTISATMGDTISERGVNVSRYVLPKFKIEITPDRPYYQPGETVSVDLQAEYTFGEPVAGGTVQIKADEFIETIRTFATAEGRTGDDGRWHFEIPLKEFFVGQDLKKGDAVVKLEATVTDSAGHKQTKTLDLTVTEQPIRIEVFPESGELVQNVENVLYIVTAYADGRPAKTSVVLGSDRTAVTTSDLGIAKVKITPTQSAMQLTVFAQDAKGVRAQATRPLRVGERADGFILRTDRAVYRTGETINAEVISATRSARMFLDIVKDRRTVLMKSFDVKDGRGAITFDLPADLSGTLELHAYRIMPDGNIVRDSRLVQVAQADQIKVSAELDKATYRPGEEAILRFIVQGRNGAPVQAALGLAGVDEAVFALYDMRPGLEEVYFAIQEEILKPRYEICAHAPITTDEASTPTPKDRPEIEEAKVVLFSAGTGGEGPKQDSGPKFEEKQRSIDRARRTFFRSLAGAASLAPFIIFILLMLPMLGYGAFKLFRTQHPVDADNLTALQAQLVSPETKKQKRELAWPLLITLAIGPLMVAAGLAGIWSGYRGPTKTMYLVLLVCGIALPCYFLARFFYWLSSRPSAPRGNKRKERSGELYAAMTVLERRCMLTMWGPILAGILAMLAISSLNIDLDRSALPVIMTVVLLTAAMLFLSLAAAVRRVRAAEAAKSLPFLRKAVAFMPWAYIFAIVGLAVFPTGWALRYHTAGAIATLTTAIGVGVMAIGAITISRHCILGPVSGLRRLWLGMSRAPALALMILIVAGLILPLFARAREAGRGEAVMSVDWERLAMGKSPGPASAWGNLGGLGDIALLAAAPTNEAKEAAVQLKSPSRIRRHFPETLLWMPEVITNDAGKAELKVPLADSITTWRIAGSAVSKAGELGAFTRGLRVFQDFFVDIDFPVALTQNDMVSVPVAVFNYLDRAQTVRLEAQAASWCEMLDSPELELKIGPREVMGAHFRLRALEPGRHLLTVKAYGSEMADAVEREVIVTPDGRPVVETINGTLSAKTEHEIFIPESAIEGASDLVLKIYPGSFSQVLEGMDGIFEMPSGCFEQTSSTTYPNILVLDYMRRTRQIKPDIEMKALNYVNLGYQRLLSYEVKGGGFEWFGHEPAHVILSAYGLMEFTDMAKVHEVDPAVIQRTREWLFSKQSGDGSWTSAGGLHSGGVSGRQDDELYVTAYVAWALADAGESNARLGRALDLVARGVRDEKDPYTLALCANALLAGGRTAQATEVLDRLVGMAEAEEKEAHWTSTSEGVTYSRGNVLDVETTALAAQAFLKAQRNLDLAHKALAWLVTQKDSRGTWHSTQATVQAMRALLMGTGPASTVEETMNVAITVNGQLARSVEITPDTGDVFRLISLREFIQNGRNTISLAATGKGSLAWQIVATHYEPWTKETPSSSATTRQVLNIDVQYDATTIKQDETLKCTVNLLYSPFADPKATRAGTARMTIVDLGVPPGFEVQTEDFDALVEKGVIEKYSLTGRQITLYFRELTGGKSVEFTYGLKAKYPVRAKTPPSRAYQYYEPEVNAESIPVLLTVL